MTEAKKNAFAKNYYPIYEKDKAAGRARMSEDQLTAPEIDEICEYMDAAASQAATKTAKLAKEPAKISPTLKKYDRWFATIMKKQIHNPITDKEVTIITGWELVKIAKSVHTEPATAKALNRFCDSHESHHFGEMFLPHGEYKAGNIITYESWAKEQLTKDQRKRDHNITLEKLLASLEDATD